MGMKREDRLGLIGLGLVVLGIIAWIGWTLATTPPPKPIEEIEKEIKAEEEKEAKAEAEAAPTEQPPSEEKKETG